MSKFSTQLNEAKSRDSYWVEGAKMAFALELERHMKEQQITKTDLANRINTSAAYVTKLLRGDANLTIDSMVKVSRAVGGEFHTHIAYKNAAVRWFDVHTNETPKPNPAALKWVRHTKEPYHEPIPAAA